MPFFWTSTTKFISNFNTVLVKNLQYFKNAFSNFRFWKKVRNFVVFIFLIPNFVPVLTNDCVPFYSLPTNPIKFSTSFFTYLWPYTSYCGPFHMLNLVLLWPAFYLNLSFTFKSLMCVAEVFISAPMLVQSFLTPSTSFCFILPLILLWNASTMTPMNLSLVLVSLNPFVHWFLNKWCPCMLLLAICSSKYSIMY